MRESDIERILKAIWRSYKAPNGRRIYLTEPEIRAVLQTAIDLGIVRLNEEAPKVKAYSTEKVI